MALMFPRLARNFVKNGYFPTDEPTLERALNALMPSDGPMCILDPCAGEGVAIAEAAHALGREQTKAFAVEFDAERARHARGLVDHCLHADLMDTMISKQSFGLLWLNPPYGDLSKDVNGNIGYQGQGRARLEKLFYQRSLSLLQYGGVLVFIVPGYVLDAELVGWLTRHYTDLRIYRAVETQFKQVVIFGRRVRQRRAGLGWRQGRAQSAAAGWARRDRSRRTAERMAVPAVHRPRQSGRAGAFLPRDDGARAVRRRGWQAARPLAVAGHAPWGPRSSRCVHRRGPCPTGISPWLWPQARSPGLCAPRRGACSSSKVTPTRTRRSSGNSPNAKTAPSPRPASSPTSLCPVIRAWDMTPGSPTRGDVLTIR